MLAKALGHGDGAGDEVEVANFDRDGLVGEEDLPGTVVAATDWWSLRRGYGQSGRRRGPDTGLVVLLVAGDLATPGTSSAQPPR
ncbi:MAG: hypothetical protein ACRDNW_28325 [Trebonia sp.]